MRTLELIVLSWWIQLLRSHPATWLRISWWGNISVGVCALLHFGLLKNVLYSTVLALHSGMLVNHDLFEKVWEIQRAENVRRTAELVDGLRVQSTLFAINEGGEMFWKQMQIKALSVSRAVKEQMVVMWASLDEEHLGQIDRPKLFKFLKSQGLSIRTEADVNDFLQIFDRTNKGGVDAEEFYVLLIVIKQLLMEPLDKDALRALFEDKYGIPWTAPTGVDVNSLARILSELGLQWSEGQRRYLLDFVGGKRGTTGVSADLLVSQLQAMEEQTLQPLQQAAELALLVALLCPDNWGNSKGISSKRRRQGLMHEASFHEVTAKHPVVTPREGNLWSAAAVPRTSSHGASSMRSVVWNSPQTLRLKMTKRLGEARRGGACTSNKCRVARIVFALCTPPISREWL
ncbi:uncharacterized protein LOC34618402 [Cyclospora cayetanensis]|uniref:Uncharacterized protein LOC34618402 n=1 Tax=Cyclospora cayetanensis TaxID=88456 RepID=A0A6P6RTT2_9EIME|nr:uncharacterized protein LOC34618402 [Cyclospora cayetanensis]